MPPSAAPTVTVLTRADLPELRPDVATILAICDPSPGQAFYEGGEDLLGCSDGVELGLRAIQTVTDDPLDRVWLQRPLCVAAPCSEELRATGTLTAWVGERAWTTELDARTEAATVPRADAEAGWPSLAGTTPAVKRPVVADAPDQLDGRAPRPFCGFAEMHEPPTVMRCFRSAVLARQPAEIVETFYGTEGGTITVVNRFLGSGAIVTYQNSVDAQAQPLPWSRRLSRLQLGVDPNNWNLDPIDGTEQPLR